MAAPSAVGVEHPSAAFSALAALSRSGIDMAPDVTGSSETDDTYFRAKWATMAPTHISEKQIDMGIKHNTCCKYCRLSAVDADRASTEASRKFRAALSKPK
jgi:hypothetical protein